MFTNFKSFWRAVEWDQANYKKIGGDMYLHPMSWEMIACAMARGVPVVVVGCDEHAAILRVSHNESGYN